MIRRFKMAVKMDVVINKKYDNEKSHIYVWYHVNIVITMIFFQAFLYNL